MTGPESDSRRELLEPPSTPVVTSPVAEAVIEPVVETGIEPVIEPVIEPGDEAVVELLGGTGARRRTPLTARQISTREQSHALFTELTDPATSAGRRLVCRDELVRLHLPLVDHCARRFVNRGEPLDDLVQVGTIGLIKSVDRFDTARGVEFSTYATPTILGEIKRYFRDKGWSIRVPRRLQELRMSIGSVTGDMSQDLGRSPTPREIAEKLGVSVEEVMEGIESANAYTTLSLDAGDSDDEGQGNSMLDSLGVEDESLAHVELRESLKPLIEQLPSREKRILLLRFFRGMTQSQIAEEIGVSQMHVSRLLNRTLAQLRTSLSEVS